MFRKWLKCIPLPLRPEDRQAGYDWSLSIWQLEVSLTQIFDRPLRGREFFEEIIRDNLDLGRPDRPGLLPVGSAAFILLLAAIIGSVIPAARAARAKGASVFLK